MNKIMLAFIGCMLFGGIGVQASGGGGGGGKKTSDRENFISNLFLSHANKRVLNQILDGKIDEVITSLTRDDITTFLDILLGRDIFETGLTNNRKVEAVQKLWNADKSAMTGEDILSTAIKNRDKSIVEFMMSQASGWTYSVEKWAKNFSKYPTATDFAMKNSADVSMLQLLNPQDLLVQDAQGDTPLHIEFEKISNAFYVTFNKNKALCLIEKMASQGQNSEHFSMVNGKGDSLLHLALERSHDKSLVDKLLDYGVETDQINSQGLSPLILAARLSVKGIDGIKGWKIEDKQQVFNDLLEKAANLEVFGVGQNNILFDPFVLGNFENFKKVVDRINTLCAEQQIACADWIAQQRKDGSVILEFLVNFDQDSCFAGKARGLPDYSPHVNYLWNARAVNQEMLHRARVVAPIKNVFKGKYTNEKMVQKLEKMKFCEPLTLEEMIAEVQRQQLAESDAEAARIEAARIVRLQELLLNKLLRLQESLKRKESLLLRLQEELHKKDKLLRLQELTLKRKLLRLQESLLNKLRLQESLKRKLLRLQEKLSKKEQIL